MSVHPRLLLLSAALVCILAPVAGLPAVPPPARDPKELAKIAPSQRLLQGEDAKRAA